LTFGALISSIDPIATLAILGNKQLRCDPLLYALVFGESVLNDAVAITLYQTFISYRTESNFGRSEFWGAMGRFIIVAVGSVVIGMAVAMACSFLLRRVNFSKKPSNEFIIIFFSAYMCYSIAELLHLSGIMALFICGVGQAHYAWYNISGVTRTTTRHAFHAFAHIAETFLYVYFGISAFFSTQAHFDFQWSLSLIIWSTILMLFSRALNIFPLSFLANLGRKKKISNKIQIVLWFAGLRGAVSFALALSMNSPLPGADKYITTTMVIIVLTTLGMGGSSNWLLTTLGLTGVDEDEEENAEVNANAVPSEVQTEVTGSSSYEQLDSPVPRHRRICKVDIRKIWNNFDRAYIMNYVGGRYAPAMEDYSAEHDSHGADNTQMTSPYILAQVQQKREERGSTELPSPQEGEETLNSALDDIELTEAGNAGVLDEEEQAVN
jgi:sodium/hydrogen exchanger 8